MAESENQRDQSSDVQHSDLVRRVEKLESIADSFGNIRWIWKWGVPVVFCLVTLLLGIIGWRAYDDVVDTAAKMYVEQIDDDAVVKRAVEMIRNEKSAYARLHTPPPVQFVKDDFRGDLLARAEDKMTFYDTVARKATVNTGGLTLLDDSIVRCDHWDLVLHSGDGGRGNEVIKGDSVFLMVQMVGQFMAEGASAGGWLLIDYTTWASPHKPAGRALLYQGVVPDTPYVYGGFRSPDYVGCYSLRVWAMTQVQGGYRCRTSYHDFSFHVINP